MNRTELSFALGWFAADGRNQDSHRYLARIIGGAMEALTFPERQNVCPMLPRLVAAALAKATNTSDPDVTRWCAALETLTGRKFANPAALNGLANDAMATARVIGVVFEQVTQGVVQAAEVFGPLHAAWNLADNNAAEFFTSTVYGELHNLPYESATGSFDSVTLRFMRQGDKTILTFSAGGVEATFISLSVGHGTLYSVNGPIRPDQITHMTTKVMSYWTEDLMVAV